MATFKAINMSGVAADQPPHRELLQRTNQCLVAAMQKRPRRATKTWRRDDPLRMLSAYHWTLPNRLVRTCIPFLWQRSGPRFSTLTATVLLDVTGAAVTMGLWIEPFSRLEHLEQIRDFSSVDRATESSVSTGTDTTVQLTATFPSANDDLYLVFLTVKSQEYGSIEAIEDSGGATDGAIDTYNGMFIRGEPHQGASSGAIGTVRGTFAVGFDDGAGKAAWPDVDVPPARLALYVDNNGNDEGIWVYPPMPDGSPDSGVRMLKQDLSYVDLYSLQLVEGTFDEPSLGSALNAGQPPSVSKFGADLVAYSSHQFHRNTPVVCIGAANRRDTEDLVITGEPLNKAHPYLEYPTSWTTIASTPVLASQYFTSAGGSNAVVTAYQYWALLAMVAPVIHEYGPGGQRRPSWRLAHRVIMTDLNGTANQVTGSTHNFGVHSCNVHPVGLQHSARGSSFEPLGMLLRAHHASSLDNQDPNELLSHAILGGIPEDVISTGRYLLVRGTVIDDQTDSRMLQLQLLGDSDDEIDLVFGSGGTAPKGYVHCLAFLVTEAQSTPQTVEDLSA